MALENPPIFEHGFVQGRFIMAVADTRNDPDRYPDLEPMGGIIRIVPLREIHLTGGTERGAIPTTVTRRPREFNLNDQGYMVDAEAEADPDLKPGVWLAHGVYRVEFNLTPRVNVPSYQILVEPKHTKENPLNLTEQAPVVTPPGYIEVVRAEDRIRAELAAVEAGEALEQARILTQEDTFIAFISDAEAARDEARGIAQTVAGDRLVTEANANSAQDSAQSASESAAASGEALAELNDQVDQATVQANRAESEAGSASQSATEAQESVTTASGHAEAAESARGAAEGHSADAETHATTAEGHATTAGEHAQSVGGVVEEAKGHADRAESASDSAETHREGAETAYSQAQDIIENLSDLATEGYVDSRVEGLATEQYVDNAVSEVPVFELPEDTATKGYVDDTARQLRSDLGDAFIERENVKRIIVSTNVDQPMEDGDLLMVAETPSYFTNFTGYTVGEQPHDWTKRWDQSGEFTIEQDPTASGGVGLRVVQNTGRTALSWDATDDDAYANLGTEVVAKWRSESNREQLRMVFQGGGEAEAEEGNYGGFNEVSARIGSIVGTYREGSASNWTSYLGDRDELKGQEWWVTRTRLNYVPEGTTEMQTRSWRWGLPEPTEWHRTINFSTTANLTAGWAGIFAWVNRDQGYVVDWYGASFGGGRAPMGP